MMAEVLTQMSSKIQAVIDNNAIRSTHASRAQVLPGLLGEPCFLLTYP